jgi:hypothetical protein
MQQRAVRLVAVVTAGAVLLTACTRDRTPAGGDACASVLSFTEPALTITAVTGPDGRPVAEAVVVDWSVDRSSVLPDLRRSLADRPRWRPGWATSDTGLSTGLAVNTDGAVTCRVPCGYGSGTGPSVVVLRVPGARGVARAGATYRGQRPGCGGAFDDGTEVEVSLRLNR